MKDQNDGIHPFVSAPRPSAAVGNHRLFRRISEEDVVEASEQKAVFVKDSIETLTSEIRGFLEVNHLVEYPQVLSLESESILQVEWEGDDWRAFLKLAPIVGAGVVYVGTFELPIDSDEVPEEDIDGDIPEQEKKLTFSDLRYSEDDEDALIRIFGREHEGEASSLRLVYVAGGVAHSWMTFAPWYEDALSKLVELRERNEIHGETVMRSLGNLRDRAQKEDWATIVARDRRFFTAASVPSGRQAVTLEILTEMTGISSSDPLLVGVSWSTMTSARKLLPEVKRELEEEALSRIPELASELIRLYPDWATLRVALRETHERALLIEKIGMNLPTVIAEVARYKR